MAILDLYMFGIVVFCFQYVLRDTLAVKATTGTLTLTIMYSVYPNKITGTITKNPNSLNI
jgi:hypothetical protein